MSDEKSVLVIGLDPTLIDFSQPGYAPGMDATKVFAGLKSSEEELVSLGYSVETCLTDFGETAEAVLRSRLQQDSFACILIGAGVRVNPNNFLLFEKLINVVHQYAPHAKLCFNTMPADTAAAVKRGCEGGPARADQTLKRDSERRRGTMGVNPSEEAIRIGPLGVRFLLTSDDSNGNASVFEVLVPVGQKLAAPAHKNDAYEEILYGIEGILTWTVDGTPIEVGPGQALCIPRGVVHRFDNLGRENVKQLVLITPAIMGPAYFREAAEVIGAAAGGPPDRARMLDVFKRHGMTLASPPPGK